MPPPGWEDNPLLSEHVAQQGVADEAGNVTISESIDDPSTVIDPRLAEFGQSGVFNGTFSRGPLNPAAHVDDINPLPDWDGPVIVQGDWITYWDDYLDTRALYLETTNSQPDDEVYFEQTVPVPGGYLGLGNHLRAYGVKQSGGHALDELKVTGTYLDVFLDEVLSVTATQALGAGNRVMAVLAQVNEPRYLRIRVGIVTAGETGLHRYIITAVRRTEPLVLPEQAALDTPAAGYYAIYPKTDGKLYGKNDAGTETELGGGSPLQFLNASVSANQNDYDPGFDGSPLVSLWIVLDANRAITGLDSAAVAAGTLVSIHVSGGDLTLSHLSGSSASDNQFFFPGGSSYTVANRQGVTLMLTTSGTGPWRLVDK